MSLIRKRNHAHRSLNARRAPVLTRRHLRVGAVMIMTLLLSACAYTATYRVPGTEKARVEDLAVIVRGANRQVGLYFEKLDGQWIEGPSRLEIKPGKHTLQATIKYVYPGSGPIQLTFNAKAGAKYAVMFSVGRYGWYGWIEEQGSGKAVSGHSDNPHRRFY